MSDIIFKLRILRYYLQQCFGQFYEEIWKRDLDSYYCCNGHECGCYGMSIRENWQGAMKAQKTPR